MRFLDNVFAMDQGQPLDFSNRTLQGFFIDEFRIDLYTDKYAFRGTSKANRLRAFLAIEPNEIAAKALQALWDYREMLGVEDDNPDATRRSFDRLMRKLGSKLESDEVAQSSVDNPPGQPTPAKLVELSRAFQALYSLEPHPRGFAFERFLSDLFDAYSLEPRGSFKKTATQIDGSFTLDSELYLLEAKWQNNQSDAAEIFTFEGKVARGASWTRGLFVSHAGFTEGALTELGAGRAIVCFSGLDIHEAFDRGLHFDEVIRRKVRRAAETGRPYIPLRTLFP